MKRFTAVGGGFWKGHKLKPSNVLQNWWLFFIRSFLGSPKTNRQQAVVILRQTPSWEWSFCRQNRCCTLRCCEPVKLGGCSTIPTGQPTRSNSNQDTYSVYLSVWLFYKTTWDLTSYFRGMLKLGRNHRTTSRSCSVFLVPNVHIWS